MTGSRALNRLTALKVRSLTKPGRFGDGGGLWLQVRDEQRRSWLFRYVWHASARNMGLGTVSDVTLAEAREAALAARKLLRDGIDPLARREAERAARAAEAGVPTFRQATAIYIGAHEKRWANAKHRYQWRATLEQYAFPEIGDRRVSEVDSDAVLRLLQPIWHDKHETASRLRGRIELVLDYAKARRWRTGDNPAAWRANLKPLLATPKKAVQHHPALAWREIGAFMAAVRSEEGAAARALEFTILTAARTGETLGACWPEIDLANAVWIVPAERMKRRREHRVPLSAAALALLRGMAAVRADADGYVFAGLRKGKSLSNMAMSMLLRRMGRAELTVHGFRSTFRDWTAETTAYPREVAEMA
ncbi:MAG TPA: integrase arm-type DNA-binding domain-containing protein, partial [Acetobacteraceae bacterium]|nr:integrase arm-type DNA-binding domain-containing protein [Acetobacteraceae bacterium]